jgi:aspartate aminotransferase
MEALLMVSTTNSFISDYASAIEESITMSITAIANQLKKEGNPIISMSAGEPDFDTPDYIKAAGIKAIHEGKTKYTPASGILELRQAVCQKLKQDQNLVYTPSQIVISCGAKQSIYNALMALINPGDEVIVPVPYWVSYKDQVSLLGGQCVFVQTSEVNQFKITADQLRHAISPATKLLILNSPSNPTGFVYTRSELEAIAQVIIEKNILVLSDEIYEKLIYDNLKFCSIAELSDEIKERTIVINGVSKAYSMTGWRIGYSAAATPIANAMAQIQSHTTSNPTTPSQWASLEALLTQSTFLEEMKQVFEHRRNLMVAALNEIPHFSCIKPQGAFYAFANVKNLIGKTSASGLITDSAFLCQALLKEIFVACVPGSGFGMEGYLRFSYATSETNIKEATDRIKKWVATLT